MPDRFYKYEELGAEIMLVGLKENELLENWMYRKGKSFADVRAAAAKGRKKGAGKFERKCTQIGLELEKVIIPLK